MARAAIILLLLLLALAGCGDAPIDTQRAQEPLPVEAQAQAVSFQAADGVTVFANYRPVPNARALIILAHQAGANRAEYATIAPRLVAEGFATLALDQRSGGTMFGAANRTVQALGRSATFDEAQADIEAAVLWAEAKGRPVLLLGSSYSSALATKVAADHPELAGLLLFSPGEYLTDGGSVLAAARRLRVPLFVTSAGELDELADARAIVAAAPVADKVLLRPDGSAVHGASTLTAELNPAGADGVWNAMNGFLDRVAPGTGRPVAR